MDMSGKRKEIEMNKKKEIWDGYSGSTQISWYLEYMREKIAGAEHLSPISTGFGDLDYFHAFRWQDIICRIIDSQYA